MPFSAPFVHKDPASHARLPVVALMSPPASRATPTMSTTTPAAAPFGGLDVERHHTLQMIAWRVLEDVAVRAAAGDLRNADEPALHAALTEALRAALGNGPFWHPLAVKADAHSVLPGVAHKPVPGAVAAEMLVVDLGVVVEGLELDCGLSVGFTPRARQLVHAARDLVDEIIAFVLAREGNVPPAMVHAELLRRAALRGLRQIAPSAGHRLGVYPAPKRETKIHADDAAERFAPGAWMVEVHVTNGDGAVGAFHEDCFYLP